MVKGKLSGRELKKLALDLLSRKDYQKALIELFRLPPGQLVNTLFSFLYHTDEYIRCRAITAMGSIVAEIADKDMEKARVIMRRLMWNLNDESGGIGWGSPEAMGEILARHAGLAEEYRHVFISYARKDGNYLEHEILQRDLLRGVGRLSQVRPEFVKEAVPYLIPYLKSEDAGVRGLAAWIMGLLKIEESRPHLEKLTGDGSELRMCSGAGIVTTRVKDLAEEAFEKLNRSMPNRGNELLRYI